MKLGTLINTARFAVHSFPGFFGRHERECPVCRYQGRFIAFGDPPRWDASCPSCRSLERHRLFKLFLDRHPELVRGTVIHFAPERSIAKLLRAHDSDYRSADVVPGRADLTLDIEAIDLSDDSVDLIVCSHVLEHVDDAKALAEFRRCLKPGGAAILMVPIVEGWRRTYENPAVTSEGDRLLHFGQHNHVRYYGADFRERVRAAGFELEEMTATGEECVRYSVVPGETIFLARSPAPR